ncbi:Hypothetical predicted protein [Prunus dulcis]|uniref:Uncharacterized protein n=1 Tax=Prunus dulcis TaxID=3755 RepID=A0A5E4FBU1_PRUDU|nr:Hypothetical predicted protein [Prunus dulcis]
MGSIDRKWATPSLRPSHVHGRILLPINCNPTRPSNQIPFPSSSVVLLLRVGALRHPPTLKRIAERR